MSSAFVAIRDRRGICTSGKAPSGTFPAMLLGLALFKAQKRKKTTRGGYFKDGNSHLSPICYFTWVMWEIAQLKIMREVGNETGTRISIFETSPSVLLAIPLFHRLQRSQVNFSALIHYLGCAYEVGGSSLTWKVNDNHSIGITFHTRMIA